MKSIRFIEGECSKIQNILPTIPKNIDKTRVRTNDE
jgi:hypothetical protein